MTSNRYKHRLAAFAAAVVLAPTLAAVGVAQPATAAPAPAQSSPADQLARFKVKVDWKWLQERVKESGVELVLQETAKQLIVWATSSSGAQEKAEGYMASIPTVSPSSVSDADALVQLAQSMGGVGHDGQAVVRGDARALFRAAAAGASRVSSNEYKSVTRTIRFSPGTGSTPPSITVSSPFTTTKVIVLAPQ